MSINFFYEDGRGIIVDEQGNEAMDLEEEVDPYNLGTLMTLSQYRAYQSRFPIEATEELDIKMEELAEELAGEVAESIMCILTSKRRFSFTSTESSCGRPPPLLARLRLK